MNLEENLLDRNAAALEDKFNNLSTAIETGSNNSKQNIKRYLSDHAQVKSDVTINIPNPEEIKDLDVSPLVHSTTMESLHIRGKLHSKEKTTMTIETAQLIADILKNTHTLTDLKLDFDIIPAAEIKLIADEITLL